MAGNRDADGGGGTSPGTADTEAASTTAGGTGLGSSASFGSSNPDLDPTEAQDESDGGGARSS